MKVNLLWLNSSPASQHTMLRGGVVTVTHGPAFVSCVSCERVCEAEAEAEAWVRSAALRCVSVCVRATLTIEEFGVTSVGSNTD